jgi:pimeloyl-ACP methyl ester carboxylesterase
MSKRTLTVALATTLIGAFALVEVAAAGAVTFVACAKSPGFSCATLPVPLDRGGALPGTLSLSVERRAAGAGQSPSAVVALAGGPGQAANPLAEQFAKAMSPALKTRDLLVFDQRGTGRSDPLNCGAFNNFEALESASASAFGALVELCALQIGPARGAFTTRESVEDIEAIRQATGYQRLVLYGTSYGTKLALEYAERYPQHVEALVLDSVVPAGGPEPFAISSFRAIGGVLGELCAHRACAGITSNPLADLARLTARLRKRGLSGSAYDGRGHRRSVSLGELNVLEILEAGDLNPTLRALLPAAVRSALNHDPDPLLRLYLLAGGFIPNVPTQPPNAEAEQAAREEQDNALFAATLCEEEPFPWQRTAPPATRYDEALAALRAIPGSAFYPFDATAALAINPIRDCASWPDASAAPPTPGPEPNVPTLILSGAQDMRTPTSAARQVAALIPDSQLVVIPYTGHSTLGSDFSGCAAAAVSAFFAGTPIQPCASRSDLFPPTPVAPTRLAQVHPPPGLGGRPGRTLTAALDAIVDLSRQVVTATLQADRELPSGSSFGGLRGGYAKLTSSAATLKDFSFVPGVKLSGSFPVRNGKLAPATIRVSGSQASPGTVRLGSGKRVTGTLGGRRFNVSIATVKLARASGAREWPSHAVLPPLAGLNGGRATRLR